jgi:DNA-binding MarR family transcriptional regulator
MKLKARVFIQKGECFNMTEKTGILILEQFLPYRLSVLSNIVSNSIATLYEARFGLPVPAWRIMAVLGRAGGLSAAEVADRTAMDKVAVSRAVSFLLNAGYINRTFAHDDRRRSALELNDKGWQVYHEIVPLALAYEQKLLEMLAPDARHTLNALLDQLTEKAKKLTSTFA